MDKSISELIVGLFKAWEQKSESNNISKLAKKMGATFTTVRMMTMGSVKKPRFYLFDKFMRAVELDKEKYLEYTSRFYPEYINVAKRFSSEYGKEPNCDSLRWIVNSHLAKTIYQQLLSGKHYEKDYFMKQYGDEGERVITRLVECEEAFYDEKKGYYYMQPYEKQIEVEMHLELLKHNALNYNADNSEKGGGSSLKQLNASAECIDEIKIMLRKSLDKAWEMALADQNKNSEDTKAFSVNFILNVLD